MTMQSVVEIADHIRARAKPDQRLIVAIAAPPGAGKSTLAAELSARLGEASVVVPMDGFHLDNAVLEPLGLLPRKGAPETFDAHGFVAMIAALKARDAVAIPLFDRVQDRAVAGAGAVQAHHRIVLVEGNYLLLDEAPWDQLAPLWDITIRIDVPMDVLEARLIRRWLDHGLSPQAARDRALGNDIPNARHVMAHSRAADLMLEQG